MRLIVMEYALKYPFSREAKEAISDIELNERIISLGVSRIKKALSETPLGKVIYSESEKKEEIASFAAARMILSYLHNQFITNRFAVNESKIVRSYLNSENDENIKKVGEHFGISFENGNIDIPTFLKFCPKSTHYRLINRRIINGNVEINKEEGLRLIEEAVKKHIEEMPIIKDPPDSLKKSAESILLEMPKHEIKITVKEGDHPPCIIKLFESIKRHENLPHTARWYLATYLIAIGMKEDQITNIYSGLPDYSEKITKYQIAHAMKRGYKVPSCTTIMSYGLCCANCRIGNPIKWHSRGNGT